MRKGIKSFCNGHGSTSTLDQRRASSATTLEEMILRLEIEEAAAARRSKLLGQQHEEPDEVVLRRRSCVDSSDRILRSAKDALNQYPRFSLDGKDAMFRSSFGNFAPRRRSICGDCDFREAEEEEEEEKGRLSRPRTVAGEAVEWCEPGVVAKLMGLEAVPVPVRRKRNKLFSRGSIPLRSRRREMERRGLEGGVMGLGSGCGPRYCVMKPIGVEPLVNARGSPARPFLSMVDSSTSAACPRKFKSQFG